MQAKSFIKLLPFAAVALLAGCGHNNSSQATTGAGPDAAQVSASTSKSGSQLWADNCNRCHNFRPPQSFSDTQWEAVVMHMRLRADLTGDEQRKIAEFMQASH